MRGWYSCVPVCHVELNVEGVTAAIGPVGDSVQIPLLVTGGFVTSAGAPKAVLCGTDFARMEPDERLVHNGNVAVANPAGDVLLWYDGVSEAAEGAYDDVLDGRLPGRIQTRLSVRVLSTAPEWRQFTGRSLLGVGAFDGDAGTLDFTLLWVTELDSAEAG